MSRRDSFLNEMVGILKERGYALTDIFDAYNASLSVPVTAFASSLTPLQAATHYLSAEKRLPPQQIAELLQRPLSTVKNALAAAQQKGSPEIDEETPYRVPVTAFHNEDLTPQEAVILFLAETYRLPNAEIARLLDRDARNTWYVLQQAKKKGGERDGS